MVEMNLLPWRDYQQRFAMRRAQIILLFAVILSLAGCWSWYVAVKAAELRTQKQIELLKQALHTKIGSQRMQRTLSATNVRWQQKAETTRQLFSWLNKPSLQALCFTEIRRDENVITFLGRARAPSELTDFFAQSPAVQWFAEIRLDHLHQQPNNIAAFRFHGREKDIP